MNKKFCIVLIFLFFAASQAFAGTIYYVDSARGNDSHDGRSLATPWKTIGKANVALQAGDTVYIRGGTYIENNNDSVIFPQNSGSPGAYIRYENYNGETVYLRGAFHAICVWSGKEYIYVKGMNCDQGSQDDSQAVFIGRIAGNHCVFENCIFKYSKLNASGARVYIQGSYNKIINCEIGYIGILGSFHDGDSIWLDYGSHHNLVEGCNIYHGAHNCVSDTGKYNIIRKNNLYNDYWRTASHGGNDGIESHCLYEENTIHDAHGTIPSWGEPAPGFQIDNPGIIFRKNKIYKVDGNGLKFACWGPDPNLHNPSHSRVYQNVIYKAGLAGSGWDGYGVTIRSEEPGNTVDISFKNNIVYDCYSDGIGWNDNTNPGDHIIGHNHWTADGDPKFAGPEQGDFHLKPDSPLIDNGGFLTKVLSDGEGTRLLLQDARYFCDGFGIIDGDVIQLEGQKETARIVSVDYQNNILVLDRGLTWLVGQGVALGYSGFGPDIGAHEFVKPIFIRMSASPSSGIAPLSVNFTVRVVGDKPPYSFYWDFRDGSSSSEQNPSHTYSKAGDYSVILVVTDSKSNKEMASEKITVSAASLPVDFSCSPRSLFFGATTSGKKTSDQYFRIIRSGSGTLNWNIVDNADWLACLPTSGTNDRKVRVTVNPSGLSAGTYKAIITVSSPEARNPSQSINMTLRVTAQDNAPFGYFDTPGDGSTVSGSLPISGWVLDDIEVTRVEIKRSSTPIDHQVPSVWMD